MRPKPCVRPGRVASMTTAPMTTLTHPRRIAPVSADQPRLEVEIVDEGAGGMKLEALQTQLSAGPVAQNITPARTPNVRGAPFSPMNPDGASGP